MLEAVVVKIVRIVGELYKLREAVSSLAVEPLDASANLGSESLLFRSGDVKVETTQHHSDGAEALFQLLGGAINADREHSRTRDHARYGFVPLVRRECRTVADGDHALGVARVLLFARHDFGAPVALGNRVGDGQVHVMFLLVAPQPSEHSLGDTSAVDGVELGLCNDSDELRDLR